MISQIIFVAALSSLAAASIIPIHHAPQPIHHAPQPYNFGYDIKDHHGQQYRQEAGNGAGGVTGSYGFTDDRGVKREVDYVADHAGFRAQVKTNEPGTANQNPAAVRMISAAPYDGGVALGGLGGSVGLGGLGYGGVGLGGLGYGGIGVGGLGYGGVGVSGLGYGGVGVGGLGYGGIGVGGRGYGLGSGLLGGLGYDRYGY